MLNEKYVFHAQKMFRIKYKNVYLKTHPTQFSYFFVQMKSIQILNAIYSIFINNLHVSFLKKNTYLTF